jgi:hypothetical protein
MWKVSFTHQVPGRRLVAAIADEHEPVARAPRLLWRCHQKYFHRARRNAPGAQPELIQELNTVETYRN